MLQPKKDRLDYGTLLMPPEGFEFDHAVATTYSLDLDALVSIPVALYFAHSLDLDVGKDIVQVLDSIRRASSAVKVFCQKGQIGKPDNQHRLYSFIEPCIVEVPPSNKHSFHPKVWVIRFRNDYNEIIYRLIVLSRNLTFDRSWDVAFQMDGTCVKGRANNFSKTRPLVDFVTHLAAYEKIPWMKRFLSDLGKTEFKLEGNEFEDFELIPLGFDRYRKSDLFNSGLNDELLIISPFVTSRGLEMAKNSCSTKPMLFSRREEMQRIRKDLITDFTAYHLSTQYVDGEGKFEADGQENTNALPQDLHAKVYSTKRGWAASLYLGSVNCSGRAMENNVEFMIELKGKDSRVGPKIIAEELFSNEVQVFELFSYTEASSEQDEVNRQNDQILQDFRVAMVNVPLKAKAIRQEDRNFRIELDFDLSRIQSDKRIEIVAYLLRSEHQKYSIQTAERNYWSVYNVAELDLSCFLIFNLDLKGTAASLQFVMKVDIADLPDSRSSLIFRDIISNTANFLKYVRFLLADDFWDEQLAFDAHKGQNTDETWREIFASEMPIYENMLKALSRHPDKLVEIGKVMNKLAAEENGSEPIIPNDFKQLWDVFNNIKKPK